MTGQHLTKDQIQRMIASDPHAPEVLENQLAQARPFTDAFPTLAEAMRKRGGSLRLNSSGSSAERISALVTPRPGLASAG